MARAFAGSYSDIAAKAILAQHSAPAAAKATCAKVPVPLLRGMGCARSGRHNFKLQRSGRRSFKNLLRFEVCARWMRSGAAELTMKQMLSAFADKQRWKGVHVAPSRSDPAPSMFHHASVLHPPQRAAPSDEEIGLRVLLPIDWTMALAIPSYSDSFKSVSRRSLRICPIHTVVLVDTFVQ